MRNASEQPPNDIALKRAVHHPKRLELLGYLARKKTSAGEAELAEALDLTAPLVKYHLAVLHYADLVAQVEDPQPGATDGYIVAIAGM